MKKLHALDLNLLLVFDALMRIGSVSKAAEEIGLTQPSMSNALTRLRTFFGDPLFVRSGGAMRPTPMALQMEQPLRMALDLIRRAVEDKPAFAPATSHRRFRLGVNETGQRYFLPQLVAHFAKVAPEVDIETVEISSQEAQEALANATIDLVIGYFADFGPNFFRQRLTEGSYAAVLRKGHPHAGKLTIDAYLNAAHISYIPALGKHLALETLIAEEFAKYGARRRIALRVAHSLGLAQIIGASDLVMTLPMALAEEFAEIAGLQITALPFETPTIEIYQYWHRRFHHDPANQWLRGQFKLLFTS